MLNYQRVQETATWMTWIQEFQAAFSNPCLSSSSCLACHVTTAQQSPKGRSQKLKEKKKVMLQWCIILIHIVPPKRLFKKQGHVAHVLEIIPNQKTDQPLSSHDWLPGGWDGRLPNVLRKDFPSVMWGSQRPCYNRSKIDRSVKNRFKIVINAGWMVWPWKIEVLPVPYILRILGPFGNIHREALPTPKETPRLLIAGNSMRM